MLKSFQSPLRDISVWKSRKQLFVFGRPTPGQGNYHLLNINLLAGPIDGSETLKVEEDSKVYSSDEISLMIRDQRLVESEKNVVCIFGIIKLLEAYYLVIVVKAAAVGEIHSHPIYAITDINTIPLIRYQYDSADENRYRNIIQKIDFTSGFYFSFTYDLTNTFQHNTIIPSSKLAVNSECNNMHAWNYYAAQHFISQKGPLNKWVGPIIYGYFEQFCFRLETSSVRVKYTLISRRSRHFAGTRNLRRGTDCEGYVANEVETEQLVTVLGNLLRPVRTSSVVQHRGSIPLFWSHVNLFSPSPDIQLEAMDSKLSPTDKHFRRLLSTYGNRIVVLNLLRQQNAPREELIGSAFRESCSFINYMYKKDTEAISARNSNSDLDAILNSFEPRIIYREYDMLHDNHATESKGFYGNPTEESVMIAKLHQIAQINISLTGFFTQPLNSNHQFEKFPESEFCRSMRLKDRDDVSSVGLEETFVQSMDEYDDLVGGISYSDSTMPGLLGPLLETSYDDPSRKDKSNNIHASIASASNIMSGWYNNFSSATNSGKLNTLTSNSLHEEFKFTNGRSMAYESFTNPGNAMFRIPSSSQPKSSAASSPLDSSLYSPTEPLSINMMHQAILDNDAGIGRGCDKGLLQEGIFRSNCIDCLDRTNIAQFCYANTVLPQQLISLGIELTSEGLTTLTSKIMGVWVQHGDAISKQYGGSVAMHKLNEKGGSKSSKKEITVGGGAYNAMTAVQRYYSNISTDFERQQAIDLLLGVFIPKIGGVHVWEIDQRPQNMRVPCEIESSRVSFPLNYEDTSMKSDTIALSSLKAIDEEGSVFGVLSVDNVGFRPYPLEAKSAHTSKITSQSSILGGEVHSMSSLREHNALISDLETVQCCSKYENIISGGDLLYFSCYGNDDLNEKDLQLYKNYIETFESEENLIQNPSLSNNISQQSKILSVVRATSDQEYRARSTVLPLPPQLESWVKVTKNLSAIRARDLNSKNMSAMQEFVSFPKYANDFSERNSLTLIPLLRDDNDMDEDDEDRDISDNTSNISTEKDSGINLLNMPPIKITPIELLSSETVESISQPFKWLFSGSK